MFVWINLKLRDDNNTPVLTSNNHKSNVIIKLLFYTARLLECFHKFHFIFFCVCGGVCVWGCVGMCADVRVCVVMWMCVM